MKKFYQQQKKHDIEIKKMEDFSKKALVDINLKTMITYKIEIFILKACIKLGLVNPIKREDITVLKSVKKAKGYLKVTLWSFKLNRNATT